MNKQDIKSEIQWTKHTIETSKMALAGYAKEMRLYKACLLVASIMALAIIPVSYAFFGEDGLFLGGFIMVIASACAFAQLMMIDNVKDLMNQTKHMIKVCRADIESMQKYGFKPIR